MHNTDDQLDWTGSCRVIGSKVLKIDTYQGGHGCLRIPFDSGICGQVASTGKLSWVNDLGSVKS